MDTKTPDFSHFDVTAWAGTDHALAGVEYCLSKIAELNPQLNAFEQVFADDARNQASALDKLAPAERGPLHGVPVAIKAENHIAGCVTTFGTAANHTPAKEDSAVVARLRAAGAIIIGTTRMPECGAWPFTSSEHGGVTKHPLNPALSPGGSSGGSAAAIASGMVPVAIGGDGGGSIRIPAANCGLYGLKAQRGRISTAPAKDLWGSLGVVGPLCKSARDVALLYEVLAGSVPEDAYPLDTPMQDLDIEVGNFNVGLQTSTGVPGVGVDPVHVQAARVIAHQLGAVQDLKLPVPTAAFLPKFLASIHAEHASFDEPSACEQRTRQLAAVGRFIPKKLQQVDTALTAQVNQVFEGVDIIVSPTLAARPAPADVITKTGAIRTQLRSVPYVAFTTLWNVTGHPAIAIPVGRHPDGAPISVQIIGPESHEKLLIRLAEWIGQRFADTQW